MCCTMKHRIMELANEENIAMELFFFFSPYTMNNT